MPAEQGKPLGSMVISLGLDSADFQKSLAGTQRATKSAMAEMKAQMGIATSTGNELDKLQAKQEGLTKVLKSQEHEVEYLNKQYKEAVSKYGENSKQATNLANRINILVGKMSANEKALKATNSALNDLTSDSAKLTKEMDLQAKEAQSLASHLRAQGKEEQALQVEHKQLSREIQNRNRLIDIEKNKLNSLIAEKGRDSTETRQQAIAVRNLETANKKAETAQENLGKEASETSGAFGEAGKGIGLFKGILAGGFALVGIRAVADAVKEVITQTLEANKTIQQFQASLGVTRTEANKLTAVGRNMYRQGFGDSMESVNESLTQTKQLFQDIDNGELKRISVNALNLATTFDADVNEVLRGGKNMMANFGVSSKKAFDLMAYGAQHGLDFSKELFDNISEYSVQFKNAGFSADNMFAILQAGAKNGVMNLDKINDTVKEFGVRIGDGSKSTDGAMSKMSTSTQQLWGKFQQGKATISQVFTAVTKDLGKMKNVNDRNNLGVALMGTQWEDVGAKAILAMGKASTATVKAKGAMDKLNNSAKSSDGWEVLKRESLSAVNGIGQALAPLANMLGTTIRNISNGIHSAFSALANNQQVVGFFQSIATMVMPIINQIVGFIKSIGNQLSTFWKENGAMITQAFQNVMVVVKPILYILITIIGGVIQNLIGIIQGGLNIIMGVIKVFAGLFTGNWKKVWEGLKQIFSGAIQFLWNFVQLYFIGRILKGFRALGSSLKGIVSSMWSAIKGFFSNGVKGALGFVESMPSKAIGYVKSLSSGFRSVFNSLWGFVKSIAKKLADHIINLPKTMANGVKNAGGALVNAFRGMWNKVLKAVGKPVNSVIHGVNWVMGKFGSKKKIDDWDVPQYAKGTDGHQGGIAMINDQKGNNYREMVTLPNGQSYVPKGRNIIAPLPAGTQVTPAKQTMMLARKGLIPQYKNGIGSLWKGIKSTASNAWEGTKKVASAVKDKAFDVWDFISQPSKLVSKVIGKFVNFDSLSGIPLELGKGIINKLKGSMASLFKREGESSGAEPKGSSVKRWAGTVAKALEMNGLPTSKPYINAWLNQIATESGGNPKAVQGNIGDINNRTGDLAKGLVQVIGATFNAYKFPGHNNRLNGLDSLLAGMNYAKSRYGIKGMLSMIGKGHGYANGGIIRSHGLYEAGEGNKPEMVIPLTRKARAVQLLDQAQRIIGVKDKNDNPIIQTGGGNFDTSNLEALVMQLIDVVQGKRLVIDKNAIVDTADDGLGTRYDNADYFAGGA